ncbi:MAG: DMT family transporter [Nitrospinota bacterium]
MTNPIFLAVAAGLMFSLSHFLVRLGLEESNPTTAVTVNVAVNAAGLWALAAFFSPVRPLVSLSAWPFVLAGLFAPSLARVLLYHGYGHMGLARAAVLAGAVPLFSVVVAVLFLGERPSPLAVAGTVGIVAGIGALSYSRGPGKDWARWTVILPLAAALCFALRDVFSKVGLQTLPFPIAGASVAATSSAVVLYLSFLTSKGRERMVLTGRGFWLFFGSGVFLVLAYLCVFLALKGGMVSLVSPLINIHPLFSVLLSYLFLQSAEHVTGKVAAGGLLIVAGAVGVALG